MPKISFSSMETVLLSLSKVLNRVPNRVSNRVPKQGSQTGFPSSSQQGSQTVFPNRVPKQGSQQGFQQSSQQGSQQFQQGSQAGFPTKSRRNFPTEFPTHFFPTAQSLGSSAVSKCFGACRGSFPLDSSCFPTRFPINSRFPV